MPSLVEGINKSIFMTGAGGLKLQITSAEAIGGHRWAAEGNSSQR
jgi:hypothetical protein